MKDTDAPHIRISFGVSLYTNTYIAKVKGRRAVYLQSSVSLPYLILAFSPWIARKAHSGFIGLTSVVWK